ncbi:MAG: hypothetical protein NVS2B7_34320 [Herpetosiphon sp.]
MLWGSAFTHGAVRKAFRYGSYGGAPGDAGVRLSRRSMRWTLAVGQREEDV